MRTPQNAMRVIVPALIHDGDDLPKEISEIQYFEIKDCFNVRMAIDSSRAEELDSILDQKAVGLANAIKNAPDWQAQWPIDAAEEFYSLLYQEEDLDQDELPRFTQ